MHMLILFLVSLRRLGSTLFPYTTLFRSRGEGPDGSQPLSTTDGRQPQPPHQRRRLLWTVRSEEHTSELQSHVNLVCRLLLEKKKAPTEGTGPGDPGGIGCRISGCSSPRS